MDWQFGLGSAGPFFLLVSVGPHLYVVGQVTGWSKTGWSDGMAVLCSMLSHIFQEFSPLWILVLGAWPHSLPGWGGGALWCTSCYSECQLRTWSRRRPPGKGRQTCEDPGTAEMGEVKWRDFLHSSKQARLFHGFPPIDRISSSPLPRPPMFCMFL